MKFAIGKIMTFVTSYTFREVMVVDTAVRCPPRTGNNEDQVKVKLGTTFTARTSPLVGFPLPVACHLHAPVPVRQKRFPLKVRWTAELRLVWAGWVVDDKARDPRDCPKRLSRSHVGYNKATGNK